MRLPRPPLLHATNAFRLSPFLSSTSPLFFATARFQPFFHQSFAHSFPFNGGWGVSTFLLSSRVPYILPKRLSDEDSRPACPVPDGERAHRVEGSLHSSSNHFHQWSYHQTGISPRLKSFVSHSYENCRGVSCLFPFWNCSKHLPWLPASEHPSRMRVLPAPFLTGSERSKAKDLSGS